MEVTRVTRALQKRLNSVESDISARPNTPLQTDLENIQEKVTTPARRTRRNSRDNSTTPIIMPTTTPGGRVTRRNSITLESASPAVASPMRRITRRLVSGDGKNEISNNKPGKNLNHIIEEHDLENTKENQNILINKRVTRSSSKSPLQNMPDKCLKENIAEEDMKQLRKTPRKIVSTPYITKSTNISEVHNSESEEDMPLNILQDQGEKISDSNISKSKKEDSNESNHNEESNGEKTPKNSTIDHSLGERQRLRSVTFNDSDENIKSPKKFPKTPISKSFNNTDLESSKEINEKLIKNLNNTNTGNDDIKIYEDANLIDNSTTEIQNEKSNSNLNSPNMKNKNSDTPYKELKLKDSAMSSSTPINTIELNLKGKKFNPIVRLAKNYHSVIDKSKEELNIPIEFSTSWGQSIRGKANEKIDKLDSEVIVEESVKVNESNIEIKKSNLVLPSDDDEEDDENEKCEYIDNEADEMDGEDSMDEEERQFLKENEIPVQGETIGSEDSDVEEEEDEDDESYIISDESENNKLLSTDSEEEIIENVKSDMKEKYKRIRIVDSSDSDSTSNEEEKVNDGSFTINKSNSIITLTDGDEVFSNGNKSDIFNMEINSQEDDLSMKSNKLSLEKITHHNTSKRKSINNSQMSGIERISSNEDSDDKDADVILNVSENNITLNQSIKTGKKTPIKKQEINEFEGNEMQISQTNTINVEHDDQDVEIRDKSSVMKSSKYRNSSINKNNTANSQELEKSSTAENKKILKSPKNKNLSMNKNSNNNEGNENSDVENDRYNNSDNEEIFINKSLKSPKNKSFNQSKILLEKQNSDAENDGEFEKNVKNQNKSLTKSPKNKNASINRSTTCVVKEDVLNKSTLKSPKNNNSSINKKSKNDNDNNEIDDNENLEDLLNESSINGNTSRDEILITTKNIKQNKKPINKNQVMASQSDDTGINNIDEIEKVEKQINYFDSDNEDDDKDYVPEDEKKSNSNSSINSEDIEELKDELEKINEEKNISDEKIEKVEIQIDDFDSDNEDDTDYVQEDEKKSNSNSSINSEDIEELKDELEKIKEEKNIPKSKLSFSFTSVTEYKPFQQKNILSKSFTTGNSNISDDSDNHSKHNAINDDENNKLIPENDLSETEELEKLKSNEFKLKQSKRKSMNEFKNKDFVLSSKKSRHSLGSTHVNAQEEIFVDLREKLNKSTNNLTKTSSVEKQENNTELNKSVKEKDKKKVVDGNFNNVSHILNRCDEILEAANQAKRELKLQNKLNKNDKKQKKKINTKKYEESSDNGSNETEKIREREIKLKDEIAKALKTQQVFMKKKKDQNNVKKLGNSTESRLLPTEILEAITEEPKIKNEKSKDAEIAKALKAQEIFMKEKNTKKKSKLLPSEILEAITGEPKIKKKKMKDSELQHSKYEFESSEIADIENESITSNKFKRKAASSTSQLSKQNLNLITSASGIFIEEPATPPPKNRNANNSKIISKQEIRSGTVYEEPITPDSKKIVNGFKECPITPKAIGFKVRSILSAGQKEPPLLNLEKKLQKRKRKNITEPITSIPKQVWSRSGVFVETKLSGKKIILDESIATDFYVMPLEIKNIKSGKNQQFGINNKNALEFKKNTLLNSKVRRETSKEMLQRKERQNIYKKF